LGNSAVENILGLNGQGMVVILLVRDRFLYLPLRPDRLWSRTVSCPTDNAGPFRDKNRTGREADHLTPSR